MITRRRVLELSAGAVAMASGSAFAVRAQLAGSKVLRLDSRVIDVHGRAASVLGISDAQGRHGLDLWQSDGFDVTVENRLEAETVIHWHGLTPPFEYDGTDLSQDLIAPGASARYNFDLSKTGTNWMHSHHGLSEQQMLAAPLIVRGDAERGLDGQEVTILLHDFSFTPPEEILEVLRGGGAHVGSGTAAMAMGMMRQSEGGMAGMDHAALGHGAGAPMEMDLNDVTFDAFLANDRDLSDPQIVSVDTGSQVRLRIINAAASTNFWIGLGALTGNLVAVDGLAIVPVRGRRFEIAMAQRLDFELTIPNDGGAFPILAQREGDRSRTGTILATAGAQVVKIASEAESVAPPVLLDLERQLVALEPLPDREPDLTASLDLTGDMMGYAWGIDGKPFQDRMPVEVHAGQRVELTMRNLTMMSHPMHLHGHHFQVVGLGQARLAGAVRDTVIVPPLESVTIAFDADNPGEWPLHCHNLYHRAVGMMTTVRYV